MIFLSWLSKKAPTTQSPAPVTPEPADRQYVAPPDSSIPDVSEIESTHDEVGETIDLEPVFITIDYVDANGQKTRRRITLLKFVRGPHSPILRAICHERRAIRGFRLDRIDCFIDDSGEVFDTGTFIRDFLMISIEQLQTKSADVQILDAARSIREKLRPALSVLVAAARSDDKFHDEELDIICQFAERQLVRDTTVWELDAPNGLDQLNALTSLIRRMRPSREALPGYMAKIFQQDDDYIDRFQSTLEKVMMADGELKIDEVVFLEEFRNIRKQFQLAEPDWPKDLERF